MASLKSKIHKFLVATRLNVIADPLYMLIFWKKLPLVWIDEAVDRKVTKLRDSKLGVAYAPVFCGKEQDMVKVSLPGIYGYMFENARIHVGSSSVIERELKIYLERVNCLENSAADYAIGHIYRHDSRFAFVTYGCNCKALDKGIAFFGNGSSNYYHWLIEILPKIELLNEIPTAYADYPLLVSEDVKDIESFQYLLNLFCKDKEVIYLKRASGYRIKNLVWITTPSNLPFNLRKHGRFQTNYSVIDKRSTDFVRNHVLAAVPVSTTDKNYPKRIIFCRKNERRSYNQAEVVDCLEKYDFVRVYMEELSFDEQVRTVYNAQIIVGPTGAAWTNLLFCRPGTKALCWMAEEIGDFSAFSTIAGFYSVDLKYLKYISHAQSTADIYYGGYAMDVSRVEQCVSRMVC